MARASQIEAKTHASFAYGVSIFLSAFLLFQVQLILGKYFLPWFGGTPAMWTTCMFFFQTLLFVGYLYAHAIANLVPVRLQGIVHTGVMIGTLCLFVSLATVWHMPLLPSTNWKPQGPENPVLYLTLLLSVSTGLPYFVLASSGPLLQRWFANTHSDAQTYRLYALSNLGSFLGLLSYPFLVEPWLNLKLQAELWAVGFCTLISFCGFCALQLKHGNGPREQKLVGNHYSPNKAPNWPSSWTCVRWFSLAACGSLLFLATTNQICQNIGVVPLLWVLPLSIYLLSLAICFERPAWYSRSVFQPGFLAALVGAVFLLNGGAITRLAFQIVLYSIILFLTCMVCHGELARSKPRSEHLTLFYLMVAGGGALSGAFVTFIAPRIFSFFWEYQLGLWLSTLFMFVALTCDRSSWLYASRFGLAAIAVGTTLLPASITLVMHGRIGFNYMFLSALVLCGTYLVTRDTVPGFDRAKAQAAPWFIAIAMVVLGSVLLLTTNSQRQGAVLATRNFYGALTVQNINQDGGLEWAAHRLTHGRVSHGYQFQLPAKRSLATSYFGITSGVGRAVTALRSEAQSSDKPRGLRIGVIGLGVGTLATYARPGDYIRFYEINPDVIRIARNPEYFTYLSDCRSALDIVSGDARLSLERELGNNGSQHFDLLAMDAFSGDAVPVHLLTGQAFQIYLNHVQDNGIIAVNVTNTYIDFIPVLVAVANSMGMKYAFVHSDGDGRITVYSDWALLTRGPGLDGLRLPPVAETKPRRRIRMWTDDYTNVFQLLR